MNHVAQGTVATGRLPRAAEPVAGAGTSLPSGPAAATVEAAARGIARTFDDASRSSASPSAAADSSRRRGSSGDVLDPGRASHKAVLERALRAAAVLAIVGLSLTALRRQAR